MNSDDYKNVNRRVAEVGVALCAILSMAAKASAASVELTLSTQETYVGMPIRAELTISDAQNPQQPEFPTIEGVDVVAAGAPRQMSQTMVFNGRVSHKSALTYTWQLTPRREQKFHIPSIKVNIDGRELTTDPTEFVATKSETGDLLFVDVVGQRDSVYVGEPIRLTLRIWVKPYKNARHNITLSASDMLRTLNKESTDWGVFADAIKDLVEKRKGIRGKEVLRADGQGVERSYYLYEFEHTVYPQSQGKLDPGKIQIVFHYPTGLQRGRNFIFEDRWALSGVQPLVADAKIEPITVKPVPTEGMPADYRGAIGRYDIATEAMPTKVKVGDQISLRLQVTGGDRLDLLQAPPLAQLPELTRDFKVTEEPLAGVVNHGVKTFVATLRPLRTDVKEIPPIPFSSFDPETHEFVTVKSDPIPIEVSPADELSLANIISANGSSGKASRGDESEEAVNPLTWQFRGPAVLQSSQPPSDTMLLAALITPPVLFFGLVALRQSSGWLRDSSLWRRRHAERTATKRLRRAESTEEIARAAFGYAADRFGLNAASLTRRELVGQLQTHGVAAEVVRQWDELLAECENSKYSGGMTSSPQAMAQRALNCIAGIDRTCTTSGESSCTA